MKWRALLMVTLMPLWGVAATLPAESAVELDLRWLSPPTVSPQNGVATAEMHDGFSRLKTGFTAGGATFAWPLRYAVLARHYPIIVVRYRARDLIAGPDSSLFQLNMVNPSGQQTPAIILDVGELVQDGVVREIRKDLSRFAGDNAIDSLRFTFNAPAGGGQLDIVELRFEQGPASPLPLALPREAVEFVVKDAAGRAIVDAEIRAGLIERNNWSAQAITGRTGRVTVPVIRPVRPQGEAVDPVEAMVLKEGYVPHYVAPIEFPRTGPVEVTLTPIEQQAAAPEAPPQATPVGQEPERVVYVPQQPTVIYQSSPSVVYVERYATAWWVPVHYVGYHPYPHYHPRDRHAHQPIYRRPDYHQPAPAPPPTFSPPIRNEFPTPREEARQRIGREIDRGNEPAQGYQDSEIYRRNEAAMRPAPRPVAPAPTPSTPPLDRGDRFGGGTFQRAPEPVSPPRMTMPREAPAPAPAAPREIQREAPAPRPAPPMRSEVERGNEPPPAGGGAGGDRGARYSR